MPDGVAFLVVADHQFPFVTISAYNQNGQWRQMWYLYMIQDTMMAYFFKLILLSVFVVLNCLQTASLMQS